MAQPRGQLSLTHTKEGDASRLPLLCGLQQPQHQTVYRAGGGAEHDDRPGHGEHLHGGAGDKSLWLCQDRHTIFIEIFSAASKVGALIVLACRYKCKPARSTHIYLNLS